VFVAQRACAGWMQDREGKVLTCGVTSAVDVAVGVLARRAFDSAKDHAQGPIITRRAKYFRTSEVSSTRAAYVRHGKLDSATRFGTLHVKNIL
jgi:hypothetical protein